MSGELIALLKDMAPELLLEIAKWGIGNLKETSPISKAIVATDKAFPDIENLPITLHKWCESDTFSDLLQDLKKGNRELVDDYVVDKFKSCTKFYCGRKTKATINQIISTLIKHLERE